MPAYVRITLPLHIIMIIIINLEFDIKFGTAATFTCLIVLNRKNGMIISLRIVI